MGRQEATNLIVGFFLGSNSFWGGMMKIFLSSFSLFFSILVRTYSISSESCACPPPPSSHPHKHLSLSPHHQNAKGINTRGPLKLIRPTDPECSLCPCLWYCCRITSPAQPIRISTSTTDTANLWPVACLARDSRVRCRQRTISRADGSQYGPCRASLHRLTTWILPQRSNPAFAAASPIMRDDSPRWVMLSTSQRRGEAHMVGT